MCGGSILRYKLEFLVAAFTGINIVCLTPFLTSTCMALSCILGIMCNYDIDFYQNNDTHFLYILIIMTVYNLGMHSLLETRRLCW